MDALWLTLDSLIGQEHLRCVDDIIFIFAVLLVFREFYVTFLLILDQNSRDPGIFHISKWSLPSWSDSSCCPRDARETISAGGNFSVFNASTCGKLSNGTDMIFEILTSDKSGENHHFSEIRLKIFITPFSDAWPEISGPPGWLPGPSTPPRWSTLVNLM